MKQALLVVLFSMPLSAIAETSNTSPLKSDYMGNLLLSLGLVVGLILALAWLVKRFNVIPQQNQGLIKVLSTLALSSRDRIALIQVGEEQLLISLTPGNITKLHSLKSPIAITEDIQDSFKSKFKNVVNEQLNKNKEDLTND